MNMPGFTAEASLVKTSDRYHLVASRAPVAGSRLVLPQVYVRCETRRGVTKCLLCDEWSGECRSIGHTEF